MATGKPISANTLREWSSNYANNKDISFGTNSVTISLDALEEFIAELRSRYPADLNGIRIYFVRYPFSDSAPPLPQIENAGKDLSQPSLVLVPLKNFDGNTGTGDDFVIPNQDQLHVMAVADPQDPPDTAAILCPPKCG